MNALTASEMIARARDAQAAWGARTPKERAHELGRLRRQIAAARELLVDAIVADTGKPPLDALAGDVLVTLEQMRFYERRAAGILAPQRVGRDLLFYAGCHFREHFEPHGTVLVFGPANYPLQLSLVPAVTALYAGNAVILKVSERTPNVALAIENLVYSSGFPADLLQVIATVPAESAAFVEAAPDFVFFTGSCANGRSVAAQAAARGIPTLLELGGSDAALVFSDCDLARTVEGILYGAFSNAGQVCVGVKRLVVEAALYDPFVTLLARRAAELHVGSGHECDLGVLPVETARNLFRAQVQDALDRGARLETTIPPKEEMPVILSNVPLDARLLREECFGPALCVQTFAAEAEAIMLANASPFALGASIWTRDSARAHRVAHALHAGNCSINDVIRNIANPHAAFGGNAASGYGRYHGAQGLRAFSRIKTMMENRSSKQRERNWFPLTRKNYDRLSMLIELRHRPHGIVAALRRGMHFAIAVGILAIAPTIKAQLAHLILKVHLPAGAHGPIGYLVFNSPDGFPQNKTKAMVHGFSSPVRGQDIKTIDIGELPPGRYAVSLYLDENSNGKLDRGFFGIPREPVGVSNNPQRSMGPPRFKDGAFTMSSVTQTLSINLVRP